MRHPYVRRVLSLLTSLLMALSLSSPAVARATDVEVANHTQADGSIVLSDVRIDGVSAPVTGTALDGTATVTAEPAAAWRSPCSGSATTSGSRPWQMRVGPTCP